MINNELKKTLELALSALAAYNLGIEFFTETENDREISIIKKWKVSVGFYEYATILSIKRIGKIFFVEKNGSEMKFSEKELLRFINQLPNILKFKKNNPCTAVTVQGRVTK